MGEGRQRIGDGGCVLVVQVMWTPEEPWEVLEKSDLYLEYPELMPL